MQFTDQVDWSFGDFLVMAGLLFSLTMAVAVVRQKVREKTQRIGLIALLLLIFLLIWAELAVGIFGTFLAGSWSDHDQKRAALLCHKLRQQSVEMMHALFAGGRKTILLLYDPYGLILFVD